MRGLGETRREGDGGSTAASGEGGTLSIHYRMREGGNVLEDETASLVFTQYADAPINPPITPGNMYGTVAISAADVEGIVEVSFEFKVLTSTGLNINYRNMFVRYIFAETMEMRRLADWEGTRRLKPNPASVVV